MPYPAREFGPAMIKAIIKRAHRRQEIIGSAVRPIEEGVLCRASLCVSQ